jgi:transcriptional regulator with XRE-family HTH domain
MTAYDVIKDLCEKNNLPMTVLEAKLGFSRGSIGKMRKTKNANADRIKKIADYFGVTPDYILTGHVAGEQGQYYLDPETAEIAQEIFEDPQLRGLFHMARNLSPDKLKAHYELMKAMYKMEHPEDDTLDD